MFPSHLRKQKGNCMARRDKKPKFPTAVVIDAVDLPRDAEDWLCDQDISTHYAETWAGLSSKIAECG